MKNQQCETSSARSLNQGMPQLEFVTIQVPAANGQIGVDLPVVFKLPHRFFFIASINYQCADAGVFLSLTKQGFNAAGGNQIFPTGGENWIPFSNKTNSAGRAEGRYIRFVPPVTSFFITADHPSANPASNNYALTICGTDDIEELISERT
jgi:hypothetical protein